MERKVFKTTFPLFLLNSHPVCGGIFNMYAFKCSLCLEFYWEYLDGSHSSVQHRVEEKR
ncbi:unnamed protein product [Nyctereutes procyonoides]|uniref:(raccoon dog) hypothetical protein n=1 Tax=Nyctereutes procyonoides TaxID=34880 RepID=A0A811ZHM6_NYCPR|nr:unnamed protein product [Nyctereutes procyonoides]